MRSAELIRPGLRISAAILIAGLYFSCSSVFFDAPQPVDAKNLDVVPLKFRGSWKNQGKACEEIMSINSHSYHKTLIEKNKLLKAKIDTSSRYRINGGKIYLDRENFAIGHPFIERDDSVFFDIISEESLVLSDSVLLRKARGCYILNIRKNNWWEIVFLRKSSSGEIQISYPVNYDVARMKSQTNVTVIDSTREDSTYFHAEFKSKSIGKVIPKESEGMIYLLKPDSTFETPR